MSPGLAASDLGSANFNEASSFSSEGPIYRRHGRYHDRDEGYYGDRYRPQYYAEIGAGSFDPDKQPGNGLWGNAEMGGLVGDALDLGVRVNWYHRSSDNSQIVSTYTDPNGLVHQQVLEGTSVETNLVPVMAVLRVRFPVTGQFQPYVGGGLGWEWLSVSGTDSSGFDIQNDYDGFGAQVFGGLNVGVAPNTGLYGEAVWNKSTVSAKFFDTALGENIKDEINMNGLAVHGGLRFTF
ncbi:MAG: outer membrane protein [Bacteroidota bacterium]